MTEPYSWADAAIGTFQFYLPYELGRYLIGASVMSAIVWLLLRTVWRTRRLQARTSSRADFNREFWSSIRSCIIYATVSVPVSWATHQGYLPYPGNSLGWATNLSLLALMIIAHDAYFYWTHRMMHHPLLFKRFHRFHHRSITPTPFTAYAFAMPEAVVNTMFVVIWVSLVPTPGLVTLTFLTIQIIRNVIGHAGLELHPRWWLASPLTRWISTTTHHDMHHNGSFNHNYGFYFTFWDRLMGTEHPDYAARFEQATARPETQSKVPELA